MRSPQPRAAALHLFFHSSKDMTSSDVFPSQTARLE
jgi:hypothetical protein